MNARVFSRLMFVILIPILAVLLVTIFIVGVSSASDSARPKDDVATLQILESNGSQILLELNLPEFQIEHDVIDGIECQRISIEGFGTTDGPGQPQIPILGAMLGIPPSADPKIRIIQTEYSDIRIRLPICPAPKPILDIDVDGNVQYSGVVDYWDQGAYQKSTSTDKPLVEILETGYIRSQRIAQLRFLPFQYDPVNNKITVASHIRVEIGLGSSGEIEAYNISSVDEGEFESTLQAILLNYEEARKWRMAPELTISNRTESEPVESSPYFKVLVDQDGIYELTYSELDLAGIPVNSLDPRTFQLFNRDAEVAIFVTGDDPAVFNPTEAILFYGEKINTKYTDTNVYWLTWGIENGLRMLEGDGTPGTGDVGDYFTRTAHLEEDHNYQSSRPSGVDLDHWYWGYVYSSSSTESMSVTTQLDHIADPAPDVVVRGLLRSFTGEPEHHSLIYLNGHLIDDAIWTDGTEYAFVTDPFPYSYLVEGENEILLELPLDGGITKNVAFINWYEIDYYDTYTADNDQLRFTALITGPVKFNIGGFSSNSIYTYDVTNPISPTRILNTQIDAGGTYTLTFERSYSEGDQYLALTDANYLSAADIVQDEPSNLRDSANGADYIVISYKDFITTTQPLVDHRTSQGYRTMMVELGDIFDEFSGGVYTPVAIHDFLEYAYNNWQPPAPMFVVLAGDSTYDYKDNFGFGDQVFVPTYLADIDPWIGETAADNRYVTIAGEDIFPDMHLGRLPANTEAEMTIMVNKILGYEGNTPTEDWYRNVSFVADDADSAGDFAAMSDDIADNYLPAPYVPSKVYYGVTHATVEDTRAAIIADINQGRLMVSYIGHANQKNWALEGIFTVDDIPSLTNNDRLAFIVPMTCLDGYYINPKNPGSSYEPSSMGESIVRAEAKGAIGSFSPTGYGVATGHDIMEKGLFTAIFEQDVTRIGPATTQAKLALYNATTLHRELIDAYLLFGDPATELQTIPTEKLSLNAGWNLVTQPLQPYDPYKAQSWLDEINDQTSVCSEVDRWYNGGWDAHIDGLTFNDFDINLGDGYFIKCSQAVDWLSRGQTITTPVTLNLVAGWNLVGIPFPDSGYNAQSLLDDINTQGGDCSEIDRWLNGGWNAHVDQLPFNDFEILPNNGYFVKCLQGSSFTPSEQVP